jgi:hypothetical protein
MNGAVPGTVIIQARVNGTGTAEQLKVIRELYPFTEFALRAASRWRFQMATVNGEPKISTVGLAFIFTPPLHSN